MKILGSLYSTLRVKSDLLINEPITKKLKELKRDCVRRMERATPDSQGSSWTTTKSTIYWNRRFRACRPQNGVEVVRPSISKFFILKLASSFMVELFMELSDFF